MLSVCAYTASVEAEMSTRSLVKAATTTESGRPSAARLLSRLNSASSGRRSRPHRSFRPRAHPSALPASFGETCKCWTQLAAHEHVGHCPERSTTLVRTAGMLNQATEHVDAGLLPPEAAGRPRRSPRQNYVSGRQIHAFCGRKKRCRMCA